MSNLIRAELQQLRTLRSTYGVVGLALALVVGLTIGDFSDAGGENLATAGDMHDAVIRDAGLVVAMIFSIFAASRVGGEYRNDTIAQRAMASPRRSRMMATKLITYGTLGAVVGAASAAVSIPIAKALASSNDVAFSLSSTEVAEVIGQVAAGSALFAVLGVAVAFITRSQPAAILVVLGMFVVEQIVMGLAPSVAQYLPYQLLNSTLSVGELAPATGIVALVGVAAAIVAAGTTLLARRDV